MFWNSNDPTFTVAADLEEIATVAVRCDLDGHVGIREWALIEPHHLRATFIRGPALLHKPEGVASGKRANGDGTSFVWFSASSLPENVVVAGSNQRTAA